MGDQSVASLTTGNSTAPSLTIGDSCAALRIISDSASVSVSSVCAASGLVDLPGPSVLVPKLQAKKGRGSGKPKKGRVGGKAATTSSVSPAVSTGTRRSARLTAKPTQTYVLQLSRISRGRLVSAAAGAAVTLAALWLALITAATATVLLRA